MTSRERVRGARLGLLLAVLLALAGLIGCSNVCEQASKHIVDCLKAHCEQNPGDAVCANVERAETALAAGGACSEDDAARAQELLDKECSEVASIIGWGASE
jgi:hypothetical protein